MLLDRLLGIRSENVPKNRRPSEKSRPRNLDNRSLRVEALEDRSLLSITPFVSITAHGSPAASGLVAAGTGSGTTTSSVATHYVVSLSPNTTSGDSVNVQVIAENAQNHLATGYSGTATITSSDASATVPATVTFQNGHASFQATFVTAGPQTLTLTDNSTSTLTGAASTNVAAPAVATHYAVAIPSGATEGKAVTVQLAAEDAENFFVASYAGTANVTVSDGSATFPATVTFKNGHASLQVTFATPGLQSVTAADSSTNSITGTGTTNVITPAAATHYVVALSAGRGGGLARHRGPAGRRRREPHRHQLQRHRESQFV